VSNGTTISASVFYNGVTAGLLEKVRGGGYRFTYDQAYLSAQGSRPISITLPLKKDSYESNTLFPVFVNMLSEGVNKRIQCRMLKIDESDYFTLLLATATEDSIGPVTVKQINEPS
jgi:HipA-like protein